MNLEPASRYQGVRSPFEGWETDTAPEEPIPHRDNLWFIKRQRSIARLER